jgi:hypothetical protein
MQTTSRGSGDGIRDMHPMRHIRGQEPKLDEMPKGLLSSTSRPEFQASIVVARLHPALA